VLLSRVHGTFCADFAVKFNPIKSVHDFVFRSWEETLGCVQTPL